MMFLCSTVFSLQKKFGLNEGMRQDGGQHMVAEEFLNYPLGYVDAFYMAGFAPFPQIKFHKAVLDGFPRQQLPSDFGNVPQGVGPRTAAPIPSMQHRAWIA
jgi:hypothetical protein